MSEQALQSSRGRQAIRWVDVGVPAVIVVLVVIGGLSSPSFLTVGNLLNANLGVDHRHRRAGMMFGSSRSWADLVPAVIATSLSPCRCNRARHASAFAIGIIMGAATRCDQRHPSAMCAPIRSSSRSAQCRHPRHRPGHCPGPRLQQRSGASAVVNGRSARHPFLVVVFALLASACISAGGTSGARWSVATGGNFGGERLRRAGALRANGLLRPRRADGRAFRRILALSLQSVRPVIGPGYEFDALAAIVVGGVSLLGGAGSVWRVLCGMFVVQLLANLMVLHGLPTVAQGLAKGAVIVAAVAIDVQLRKRMGRAK